MFDFLELNTDYINLKYYAFPTSNKIICGFEYISVILEKTQRKLTVFKVKNYPIPYILFIKKLGYCFLFADDLKESNVLLSLTHNQKPLHYKSYKIQQLDDYKIEFDNIKSITKKTALSLVVISELDLNIIEQPILATYISPLATPTNHTEFFPLMYCNNFPCIYNHELKQDSIIFHSNKLIQDSKIYFNGNEITQNFKIQNNLKIPYNLNPQEQKSVISLEMDINIECENDKSILQLIKEDLNFKKNRFLSNFPKYVIIDNKEMYGQKDCFSYYNDFIG